MLLRIIDACRDHKRSHTYALQGAVIKLPRLDRSGQHGDQDTKVRVQYTPCALLPCKNVKGEIRSRIEVKSGRPMSFADPHVPTLAGRRKITIECK